LDRSTVSLLASVFCGSAAVLGQETVLGKLVYDLTGRKLDLGLLGLVEFAPAFLLVLVTGSVADRLDRRRVAATASVVEAVLSGAMGWYAGSKPTSIGPIFALAFLFGIARAFAAPAARSLPADMVQPGVLPWLIARYSAMWQAAIVVGPVLAGFLYAVDVRLPFVASAVLSLTSAVAILNVQVKPRGQTDGGTDAEIVTAAIVTAPMTMESAVEPVPVLEKPGLRDAFEGLRFIRGYPVLLGAISLDLFAVLFGGAVALLPAIAKDRLGVGAVGLGWLRAAGGLGAAAVTVTLAMRPIRRRVGRTLLSAVATFGLLTIVLGVTRSFVVAFVAMAVLSGADAVSVFVRATLVPLVTPEDKRGRVLAVENVFIGASNELGAFESGVAGQLLGTAGAVVLGGAATLAIAGGWWFLFPALRDVDRFPGDRSEPLRPP
jgi:predicted MFS family arabinose efflux permease